jgi:hypothetical protein
MYMDLILSLQRTSRQRNQQLTEWANAQRIYIQGLKDKHLIRSYTDGSYTSYPGSYTITKDTGSLYTDHPKIVKNLVSIIQNSPRLGIPLKLFRGIESVHPVDNVIVSPYLSSTSFKKKVSIGFTNTQRGQENKCCLYILNMPANFPGLLIGRRNTFETIEPDMKQINSSFDDEYEVLVPPFIGHVTSKTIKNKVIEYQVNDIVFPDVKYDGNLVTITLKDF